MNLSEFKVSNEGCMCSMTIPSERIEEVLLNKVSLNNYMENNNVELVVESVVGNLEYVHITIEENLKSILKNGFKVSDIEGNLGMGLYVCDRSDIKSLSSLMELASDFVGGDAEEAISIIKGTYNGSYLKCVYSIDDVFKYNEGFIMIKDVNKININNHYTIPLKELKIENLL